MHKVDETIVVDEKGMIYLILRTKTGLFVQQNIPTGSCWMLYWVRVTQENKGEFTFIPEEILKEHGLF